MADRRRPRIAGLLGAQGLSAGTNFVATTFAARQLTLEEFGEFALLQSIVIFVVGLSRVGFGEAHVVYGSKTSVADLLKILFVTCISLSAMVAFTPISGEREMLPLVLLISVVSFGEVRRTIFLARGPMRRVVAFDGLWFGSMVLSFIVLRPTQTLSVLAIWLASGVVWVPLLVGLDQLRRAGSQAPRRLWVGFSAEHILGAGAQPIILAVLGSIFGTVTVGTVRLLALVFFPVNVAFSAVRPSLLERDSEDVSWGAITGGFVTLVVATAVSLVLTPDRAIAGVVGEAWFAASPFLFYYMWTALGGGLAAGPGIELRRQGRVRRMLTLRAAGAVVTLLVLGCSAMLLPRTPTVGVIAFCVAGLLSGLIWLLGAGLFEKPPLRSSEL